MDRKDYDAKHYPKYSRQVKRVKLTLSLEEFSELERLSEALNIAPAKLAKRLTMSMIRGEKYVGDSTVSELQVFSSLIRNIASNINQIAKHSNRTKQVLDDIKAFDYLKQLEDLVYKYIKTGKAE